MKNLIKNTLFIFAIIIGASAMAQNPTHVPSMKEKVEVVALTQTPGEFNKEELKLESGKAYRFDVTNKGVDHAVGFVIAPKGKTDQANHIANAYVTEMVKEGETQSSKTVVLEKGEYVFFCPLNPTPEYKITVE